MKARGCVWLAVGLVFLSCTGGSSHNDSGQTGSTSCALPCPCLYLVDYSMAKATVLDVEQDNVTIQVEQLLNPATGDEQYAQQKLTGTFEQQGYCAGTKPALPKVGDEVVATFAVDNYEDARRVLLRTQPWGDQFQLIGGVVVPLSEAIQLSGGEFEGQSCLQRFPTPCKDTR